MANSKSRALSTAPGMRSLVPSASRYLAQRFHQPVDFSGRIVVDEPDTHEPTGLGNPQAFRYGDRIETAVADKNTALAALFQDFT